jgi:hypothetical protein
LALLGVDIKGVEGTPITDLLAAAAFMAARDRGAMSYFL